MRETEIYEYYAFGYNYYLLRHREPTGTTEQLASDIDDFLEKLSELDLQVTLRVGERLSDVRNELRPMTVGTVVNSALATRVRDAVNLLDETLDAELSLRTAYIVTPKRYAVKQLLTEPATLLGQNVFGSLSTLAQFDFTEACRCIAFARPTAGAFHLMRSVEEALRRYYCAIVKRGRPQHLMWGPMIQHLTSRRDSPPRPLLDNLDNIRANFRNPTQHPDARYDIDEVQDLLAVVIDALGRLSRDLKARAQSGVP